MVLLSLECDIMQSDQTVSLYTPYQSLSLKIFGVKEWSVLDLMTSKPPLASPPKFRMKAFPSEKVMITTQIYSYPPHFFFLSPLRKKICKPQAERKNVWCWGETKGKAELQQDNTEQILSLWTNLSSGKEAASKLCVGKVTSPWPWVSMQRIDNI